MILRALLLLTVLCPLGLPAQIGVRPPLTSAAAETVEKRLAPLAEEVRRATVGVLTRTGTGSAVIVSADGLIATAGHLFDRADERVTIVFSDGRRERARTLGRTVQTDVALMRLDDEGPWPFVRLGKAREIRPGVPVFALGHPGGPRPEQRPAPLRLGRLLSQGDTFIRTSTVIDSGDSGGPLFDMEGRLIGIHSRIGRSLRQNMHAPIEALVSEWARLLKGEIITDRGFPAQPILGIRGGPGPGRRLQVEEVYEGLPAAEAGLQVDDLIESLDGRRMRDIDDVLRFTRRKKVGDVVKAVVLRGSERLEVDITLAGPPGAPEQPEEGAAPAAPESSEPESARELPSGEEASREMPTVAGSILERLDRESRTSWTDPFKEAATRVRPALVRLSAPPREGGERPRQSIGTVVAAHGLVLAKLSEVDSVTSGRMPDGRELTLDRVHVDADRDLALLAAREVTPETPLPTVTFSSGFEAEPGRIIHCVAPLERRSRTAIVSVRPRDVAAARAFLGVRFGAEDDAILIDQVLPDTAASRAGLEVGDRVVSLDGKPVTRRENLIASLRTRKPGDTVRLSILRAEDTLDLEATLGRRPEGRARPTTPELSERRHDLDGVFQHDGTPLRIRDLGSPILDLEGRIVGISMARQSRYGVLAHGAETILSFLEAAKDQAATLPGGGR